jgi:O-antigen/teichoic acid export membrane protein
VTSGGGPSSDLPAGFWATLGRRVTRRGMVRSTMVLAGGTAAAQLFTAAAAPFITRIYDPSEVGQFGLVLTFVNIAAVVLSLRLEMAIVSCPTEHEASRLARLAILIVPVSTVVATAVFLALVAIPIGPYGSIPLGWALLIPVPLMAVGTIGVLRYWVVRRQEFGLLSHLSMVQSGVRAVSQVLLGLLQSGPVGLFVGDLMGRSAGVVRLAVAELPAIAASSSRTRVSDVRQLLRRHWRFPVISVPSSFVDVFASSLPLPLIGQFYGLEAAGYYVLVGTVLSAPASVVATSVADVFHGRLSELKHTTPSHASRLFLRTAGALAIIAGAIAVPIAILAPVVFPLVFGAGWEPAGELAAVMALRLFSHLVVSPLSRVVYVYEGQASKLLFDVAVLIGTVGAITFASSQGFPLVGAVATLAVTDLVIYGFYGLVLWNLVRRAHP